MGFRDWGLGVGVQGLGVEGLGNAVSGIELQGLELFGVQGWGSRDEGLGSTGALAVSPFTRFFQGYARALNPKPLNPLTLNPRVQGFGVHRMTRPM